MTAPRKVGAPAIAAMLGVVGMFLATSCANSASSANLQTPSVGPSLSPVASPTQAPSPSPPPGGGPVPAQLLGDWFLPPAAVTTNYGFFVQCPSPATAANCFFQLTFTATTYQVAVTAKGGSQPWGFGDVVVNKNEIDFFNSVEGQHAPDDFVGRYTWVLTGGFLHLTLISDQGGRAEIMPYQTGWSRTR